MIRIVSKGFSTPFSRGLLAQRLSATGLDPKKAYSIAEGLLLELKEKKIQEISAEELDKRITEILLDQVGKPTAKRFVMYKKLREL
ncbi:MAG: ATP cone domain-containing protein, partial [Asgard group archaeon]